MHFSVRYYRPLVNDFVFKVKGETGLLLLTTLLSHYCYFFKINTRYLLKYKVLNFLCSP